MSPRARGGGSGQGSGPGAGGLHAPSQGNRDSNSDPLIPLSALYREYRSLKEALGQAGSVDPYGSKQSLPAAAEQVPGLDIPIGSTSCMPEPGGVVTQPLWGIELGGSRGQRGKGERVEEGQPLLGFLWGVDISVPPHTPASP